MVHIDSPQHSERRHRLNPGEIEPVKNACLHRLEYFNARSHPEDILEAGYLFRVFFRLNEHVTSRPTYPPHETMEEISSYLGYVHPSPDEGVK